MTNKERELIGLMFDAGITPETWPKKAVYAAQDKTTYTWGKNALMFYTDWEFPRVNGARQNFVGEKIGKEIILPELCRNWDKTVVHRDEFMKRWNERIQSATNATTPPAPQELHAEETKPIKQEEKFKAGGYSGTGSVNAQLKQKSATDTQIGGNHYTKLAIQPMRYSMENGLDALQHTVIKYVTRFRDKNGIEDLEKAKHCIDMLIEFERNKK